MKRTPRRAHDDEPSADGSSALSDDHDHVSNARELAERRLEQSLLVRLDAFLARRTPGFVVLVGFLLLALFGLIDAVTRSFDVAPLYLLPVALVTFTRGRWLGASMALAATVVRGAAEVARGVSDLQSSLPYWSGLTRFYVFMALVLLIGPMRDVLRWQRDLTATLQETNVRLEAMNELREALRRDEAAERERQLAELVASLEALAARTPVVSDPAAE